MIIFFFFLLFGHLKESIEAYTAFSKSFMVFQIDRRK